MDVRLNPGEAVDELEVLSFTFNDMARHLGMLFNGLEEKVKELEETREQLIDSEKQYRSLNDNIPVGVFRTTPEGKILSSNPALFQMIAIREEDGFDTLNANQFYADSKDRISFLIELECNKKINGFECLFKRSDGTKFTASISARIVEKEDGQVDYIDGIIEDITERKKAEQDRKASETRLRTLAIKLQQVEETHRKDIARELHDRVGQSLTALNINLNILQNQLQPEQLEKVNARILDSIDLVEETTEDIHDVMAALRPQVLDDYGLAAALRCVKKNFATRTGIKVDLETTSIENTRFPETIETALFRIAQEAMNNVVKHAQADTILVAASKDDEGISLTIIDNGKGFDVADTFSGSHKELLHWGLINMRERAEALGGRFQIESDLGKSTRLTIKIPVHTEGKDDQRISG